MVAVTARGGTPRYFMTRSAATSSRQRPRWPGWPPGFRRPFFLLLPRCRCSPPVHLRKVAWMRCRVFAAAAQLTLQSAICFSPRRSVLASAIVSRFRDLLFGSAICFSASASFLYALSFAAADSRFADQTISPFQPRARVAADWSAAVNNPAV